MTNIKKLQSYLINYLITKESKIVMLSGVWGSGKTHFWHQDNENSIEYHLAQSEKPHIYISLYGKASLKAIEDEVFIKASNRSLNKDSDELDSIEKLSATFSSSSAIGLIEKVTGFEIKNILNLINEQNQKNKQKDAKSFLNNLVICFDDFERKSKDVDLNDLFGFITNLSLEFGANIVIILNDDVFNEEDKNTFYNVKEKSVNKFLKFNPSKEELFKMIFSLYKVDKKYENILLSSIIEMDVLNARIYKTIFENFEELIQKYPKLTDSEIRFFIISITNFNLTHKIFKFYDYPDDIQNLAYYPSYFVTVVKDIPLVILDSFGFIIGDTYSSEAVLIDRIKKYVVSKYKRTEEPNKKNEIKPTDKLVEDLRKLDKYTNDIWLFFKLEYIFKYRENVSEDKQRSINDFIENGYL